MSSIHKDTKKTVDMNALVSSMTRELDYYWSLGEVSDNGEISCVIYKVQEHIRMVDKLSYEPCVLSVGPYHHGAPALQTMQKDKWSYLDFVLNLNTDKTLQDYLLALHGLSKLARSCYSEDIKMDAEEFLQMLLLDGCFVLVALGGTKEILAAARHIKLDNRNSEDTLVGAGGQNRSHPDDVLNETDKTNKQTTNQESGQPGKLEAEQRTQYQDEFRQWFYRFLVHDLFLLENQIPFFIVKKIFDVVAGNSIWDNAPFTHEIVKYVEAALRWFPKSIQESDRPKDFHNLLHLCHMYFRPSQKVEDNAHQSGQKYLDRFLRLGRKYLKIGHDHDEAEECSSYNVDIPCLQDVQELNRWCRAAQYLEAGVKFKKREHDKLYPHSLLDIKFSNGTMEVPCVVLDEFTGTLFRNLLVRWYFVLLMPASAIVSSLLLNVSVEAGEEQ